MHFILIIILLAANIPIYKKLFKVFFPSEDDFKESVKYYFTPDLVSLFRGEYFKDRFSQGLLGIFLLSCGIVVAFEYTMINHIIIAVRSHF